MADQYQYGSIPQPGQPPSYPQFAQYSNAGGDQNAQFLQGYTLAQGNPPAAMFGGPTFNQSPYPQGGAPMSVPQLGAQINTAQLGAGFPYGDYSQFNPYGQSAGVNIQASLNDVQQFGQLLPSTANQAAARNIYEAFAREQLLTGFNAAFMQDTSNVLTSNVGSFSGKGFGGNQRPGITNFENGNRSSNLPSVTNPDGLREDTIFVSKLPQNIDHEIMKAQFGIIGKIKLNAKTGMPMIWIFKERGIPKGDALVTFEDSHCVQKAIKHFSENEFLGKKIEVKQAKNSQRPVIIPSSGQQQNSGGPGNRGGNLSTSSANTDLASFGGNQPADMYGSQFNFRNDVPPMQSHPGNIRPQMNAAALRGMIGSGGNRSGDWCCQSCGRFNFAGRDQCKPCGAPRPSDGMMMMMSGPPQRGVIFSSHQMGNGSGAVNGGSMMPPPPRGMGVGAPPMMPPPPPGVRVGAMPPPRGGMPMRGGGGGGGGRGGGPMRGSSINAGRNMRTNPY